MRGGVIGCALDPVLQPRHDAGREELLVHLKVELAQRQREMRLQDVEDRRAYRALVRDSVDRVRVDRVLERRQRCVGIERILLALDRAAAAEKIADARLHPEQLVGIELVERLRPQLADGDLVLDHAVVDEGELVERERRARRARPAAIQPPVEALDEAALEAGEDRVAGGACAPGGIEEQALFDDARGGRLLLVQRLRQRVQTRLHARDELRTRELADPGDQGERVRACGRHGAQI